MVEKSPDAFRTISEAAEELDVPQHVLRFWETRFSQVKPMKRAGGRRYYRHTIRGVQKILKEDGAPYVAGVGRGEIEPRKREGEMASAPPPGMAKAAPRAGKAAAAKAAAALPANAPAESVKIVNRLSDNHADMLRAALRDLGDARKILDPTLPR
jgi:hypothetical protein